MLNGTRSESQFNIDAVNILAKLGPQQSFTGPEGMYKAIECLSIAIPTPHPSEPPPAVINPLAPSTYLPYAHSTGVRLSFTSLHYSPAPGTVEYQQQLLHLGCHPVIDSEERSSMLSSLSTTQISRSHTNNSNSLFNTSKAFGINSSWTSSFFASNTSARQLSTSGEDTAQSTHSDESNTSKPATDTANGSMLDENNASNSSTQSVNVNHGNPHNSAFSGSTNSSALPLSGLKRSLVSTLSIGSSNKSTLNGHHHPPTLSASEVHTNDKSSIHSNRLPLPTPIFTDTLPLPPDSIGGILGPLSVLVPSESVKDLKRKKPKSSLVKNNSSFISKTIVHENLSKKLNERAPEDFFIWVNAGRSFYCFDLAFATTGMGSTKEYLSKTLFTKAHPLCHDVNQYTRSSHGLDVVLGMSTGDAIWMDAVSNRYNRINKNGDVTSSPITDIKWIPGSSNYFVTLHANGSLIIFDKDKEDGGFANSNGLSHQDPRSTETFRIVKSLYGTASPGSVDPIGNGNKHNPVAMYRLSHSPLTSVVFSPDRQTLVVTSSDGYMRLLNLATEVITDIYPSYYGGILSCAFSPDGKYLVTGGHDDLVSIWSIKRKTVIARGYGHQSWVRKVAFDNWNCDEFSYRVGSVADDGNLILWDFSPKTLSRPKTASRRKPEPDLSKDLSTTSVSAPTIDSHRGHFRNLSSTRSIASAKSASTVLPSVYIQQQQQYRMQQKQMLERLQPDSFAQLMPQDSAATAFTIDSVQTTPVTNSQPVDGECNPFATILHPFVGHADVPIIPPVVVKTVKSEGAEPESLSDIAFLQNRIIVAGKDGKIWSWSRPGFEI